MADILPNLAAPIPVVSSRLGCFSVCYHEIPVCGKKSFGHKELNMTTLRWNLRSAQIGAAVRSGGGAR
jgi:hypothetical protein